MTRPGPPIWVLIIISTISPLGMNIFQPSLPALTTVFGVDYATVQLTLTVYLVSIAISQIIVGPLSDRFGRRPVLLCGMGVFLLGSALCATAPGLEALLVGRVLQGMGGCTGLVLSRAMVRDLFERREAASMIGYVTVGFAVAPALAPLIGGTLDTAFGWRAPFVFLFGFGAVVTIAAYLRLSETRREAHVVPMGTLVREFAQLARAPLFLAFAITSALASAAFFAFVAGSPYVVIDLLGRSSAEYGAYFVMVAGGYMIGNFLSGRFAARIGTHRMMQTGCVIQLVSVTVCAALFAGGATHPLALFGPLFVMGVANGLTLPSALAGAVSVRPDLAGAASGLAGSIQIGTGALLAPIVSGLLDETIWPMLGVMLAASVLALGAALIARRLDPQTNEAAEAAS